MGMVAITLKLSFSFPSILIGRILHGMSAGIANICFSKSINEYVPSSSMQIYSLFIPFGVNLGCFISNLLGATMVPLEDKSDPNTLVAMKNDQNWRLVWASSTVPQIVCTIILLLTTKVYSLTEAMNDTTKI